MDSYSNPLRVSYSFPAQNFTAPIARHIKPPPNCTRGLIRDIHVSVTTAFTQTTTPGHVEVGDGTTDTKYADLNMGAAAINTAYSTVDAGGIVAGGIDLDRDGITGVVLKTVAPTGGTPAGVGDITLTIDWS
ncbi:MAG: hypothetical protein ACRDK7_07665 [Solirubrobacteraceae bacterium]